MDAEGMTLEDEESLAIQNQLVEQYASGDLAVLIDTYGQVAVDESIGLMRVQDFIIANANYDQTAADTSAEGEDAQAAEGTEAADHADGSTTDGQSTDGRGYRRRAGSWCNRRYRHSSGCFNRYSRMTVQRIDGCCL